jgi:hypothetical protein
MRVCADGSWMPENFSQVGASALFGARFAVMPGVLARWFGRIPQLWLDANLTARQKKPISKSSIFV